MPNKGHEHGLRASYHDAHKPNQDAYDSANPHRRLNNWERAELREICQANGIQFPEPTLDNFVRIVGRKPQAV